MFLLPFFIALFAACSSTSTGPGGPIEDRSIAVDGVTPLEGAYGTTVTVRGRNLQGAVHASDPDGSDVILSRGGGGTALSFQFAFPAEGAMTLEPPGGAPIALGAFTPRWTPGKSATFDPTETVHASAALGEETVLLVSGPRGVGFFVFGGETSLFVPVSGVAAITSAAMRTAGAAGSENVEAIVVDGTNLRHVAFDGRAATVTAYTTPADPVLGVGDDGNGFVVVTLGPSGIARLRGAPPTLTPTGAFVTMANDGMYRKVRAVTGNGTVIYAWDSVGGDIFDEKANFNMKGLGPTATAFGPTTVMASIDDDASELSISVADGVARIDYCAIDQDALDPKMRTRCGVTYSHDGASRLDLSGSSVETEAKLHVTAGKLVYARCAQDQVKFGVSKDSEEVAIWPCGNLVAVTPSATGPRIVVAKDGKLWAARKR
jgi:hypothetical protein